MNTSPFDTQKVCLELKKDLRKARQAYTRNPSLAHIETIRWIQNKINFLNSPIYQERKRDAQS